MPPAVAAANPAHAPNPEPESHTIERLILFLVLAAGVICVLTAEKFKPMYWGEVLSKLGDALVIAALIGLFVELRLLKAAMKRMELFQGRTVDEIRAIMTYGLKKHLPAKLVDTLEKQVLYPAFLREDFSVLITLSHEAPQHIRGTVQLRYYIKNITSQDQKYTVRVYLDEVFGDNSAALASVTIDDRRIDLSKPHPGSVYQEANTLRFEYPVVIRADERVHVEALGYQLMADADVWPWHLVGVADSLNITVSYPQDLFLWLLPIHPVSADLPAFGLETQDASPSAATGSLIPFQITQAAIKDIILPFQGFEVRWKPKAQLLASTGAAQSVTQLKIEPPAA